MNCEEVLKIIRRIIKERFHRVVQNKPILLEDKLGDDLGLDSVHLVDLIVAIEDEFNIRFDPMEVDLVEVFKTVESLVNYITKNIPNQKSSMPQR